MFSASQKVCSSDFRARALEPRPRRESHQGATRRSRSSRPAYLAKSPDGRAVRPREDALTRGLQMPPDRQASTKLKALANLTDLSAASPTHDHHVTHAADALAAMDTPVMLATGPRPPKATACASPTVCECCIHTTCATASTASPSSRASAPRCWPVLDGDDEVDYVLDLGTLRSPHHARPVRLARRRLPEPSLLTAPPGWPTGHGGHDRAGVVSGGAVGVNSHLHKVLPPLCCDGADQRLRCSHSADRVGGQYLWCRG